MITKLQPHFLSIWTFQSWNLAYNVSVEWDAPEDKYEWIKKGIQFVQEGVDKNRKSPDLVWDTAWYYYHKLGFSDESIILRRLFRDDERRGLQDVLRPRAEAARSSATTTSSWATAGSAGRSSWWTQGDEPAVRRARRTRSSTSTRPRSARGGRTTSRSARCRPTARPATPSPGEDEHATASRHLRREGQERVGQGAERVGQVRQARLHVAQRDRRPATARLHRDPVQIDDAIQPGGAHQAHREPEVLDAAAGPTR